MLTPALLLAVAVGACAHFVRHDTRVFTRFKTVEDTPTRQRTFLRWTLHAAVYFLGMPLVGLALLGRIDALWVFPAEFTAIATDMPEVDDMSVGFVATLVGAVFAGGLLGGLLAARRRKPIKPRKAIDIDAMIPRNRAEAVRIALLGANAALTEEVCFRLYIPLLFALLGVAPWIGFAASVLLFGAMHRYQGWLGMVLTSLLGMMFAFAYLASGGLALPILLHLLLNWNGLILRPAIKALATRRAD
jgi:membrane protease YdiL (CAAX protease family)